MQHSHRDPRNPTTAGQRAWIFTDGKAGHEAQCLGVAEALGLAVEMKPVAPSGPFKLAAPWAPVSPQERFGRVGSRFAPPWPAFAFATGRTTIPYIRALKRRAGLQTFTVVLMDPRTGPATADLIWVPGHDRLRAANVITTPTAPHRFPPERLAALRAGTPEALAQLPSPRVAVLIGGPNANFHYGAEETGRLVAALSALAASGAGLMITPSRRTPEPVRAALDRLASPGRVLVWDGSGDNPYPHFLAAADAFVVTADSVSMTCEAASTGKPIYVFMPAGTSQKFQRFHEALIRHGATRVLPEPVAGLESWSYPPLDSASVIAGEIARRWQARQRFVPGLIGHGAQPRRADDE